MRLNEHEALLTSRILLVPYSDHHVPTYHEWMQDPDLQAATASEPLTLASEYAMQKSWRTDADKLTLIACTAPSIAPLHITAKKEDAPSNMIGDVNLFLNLDDENEEEGEGEGSKPQAVTGEVEIMIASKAHQGKGLGREILLSFLWYVLISLEGIMAEYHCGMGNGKTASCLKYLRVKIDKNNARSVKLFESVGFKKVKEEPNYFGELELRWSVSERSFGEIGKRMDGGVPQKMAYKWS